MKFLLPSKVPQFDFQFQLLASQDYWTNFKHYPIEIEYADNSVNFEQAYAHGKWNDYCPVGSIEFCQKHGISTLPRNIPTQLKNYAAGLVISRKSEAKDCICLWHVKATCQIKHPKNSTYSIDNIPFEDGEFQAVEWLDEGFISEWRIFVLYGDIIDVQNYAGDVWTLPDKNSVECIIYAFEHAHGSNVPPSYTLDVGVHRDNYGLKTSVIEVHDFYACGTYNFNDHYHFPIMLWEWWNWYKHNERKQTKNDDKRTTEVGK